MRRTAPPSRTYGRSAVGLRPILDPGAARSTRPTAGRRRPKEDQSRQADGLTRPHSFRNDSKTQLLPGGESAHPPAATGTEPSASASARQPPLGGNALRPLTGPDHGALADHQVTADWIRGVKHHRLPRRDPPLPLV